MKKYLALVLLCFIILNILDKVTTYFGIQRGFIEFNSILIYFFNTFGIILALIIQVLAVTGSMILIYIGINKLSEKIKYIHMVASVPIIFIIGKYVNVVISNVGYLL